MHRLFVGLSLPEIAADALSQLQFGLVGARWRPPENFHITLQFIGEVDRYGLDEIASAMEGIAAAPFELKLATCGFFGDRKPRALWVGVAPCEPLTHLRKKVSVKMQHAGVALEARKFVPHVTLAYLKGVSQDAAALFCARHGLFSFGPFPVDAFHLYESYLGGAAAHYEIVETYPLSSSSPPSSSRKSRKPSAPASIKSST